VKQLPTFIPAFLVDKIAGLDFYPGPFYSTINLCLIIKVESEKFTSAVGNNKKHH
jgi:hypothetical protein